MLIKVKAIPLAKEEKIIKKKEDEFVIKIKEPPQGGKANEKIKKILGEYFQISPSKIIIKKGHKERNKILEIQK